MKKIKSIIIVLLIALFLFPPHVFAKTSISAELPQPAAEVQITDGRAVFSLDDLRPGDRNMIGPFDSVTYFFSLPPNWKLSTGGAFELRYDVLIQGFDLDRVGADRIIGANLTVQLNDVIIANITTRGTGSYVEQISIPTDALVSPRADGRHRLVITLDAQLSCQYELNAYATIHSSSFFDLSFEEESPQLDFARFPAPFYLVNSIAPDGVIMVMPDNPDPMELQAVMNVAAGFGALISGDYNFQFVNYGNLT
ncbi:MAG TPA: cellulose biosynthesis cyclic di-GMP-binding regulatory protein BcsB, partial [Anaerolineales bacterium]|nr:cellulose biosynthesis cyclic di-GMP-binding regulatory protein BcsB [Anaerolineales bacterium]